MFDNIFAAIEKWMRELLSGMVESNLSTMFTAVNRQTSEIAAQVGQTPQGWNSSIFSMIRNISDSVVIPIAGIIITLILCYELISMLTERNNLHDVDTWMFFKYFVKMWIAVYLVSHTFDIAMAVFDIGQSVVNSSSGIIRGNTAIDISSLSMQMQAAMATMAIGELVTLALETLVVSWCLKILSVVITVIMYGRMIEIYLYTSLAPIPFATMSNREWGHVGTNYFRGLFALAFQALDDGLRGNLCSPHRQHPGIFGYSLGVVRHDGLHGDSLFLAAQNGKSVQTDLWQSLNLGKSNERKRQQTTPFPGGGHAVLVINGLCNDSQRPFQSEKQGLSEPDETPACVYGFRGRNWCSVLFSHARYAGNQQCSGRHGASDAAGIFLCSVREKRDAP